MTKFLKQIINQIEVQGKIVLARVDYNVPLVDGEISDDTRIQASLPLIRDLLARGAKQIILLSHMGRPNGRDMSLSLEPISSHLAALLGTPVAFEDEIGRLRSSNQIVLYENLRFWGGEEANDPQFAQEIVSSTKADLFVLDGFSVSHRASATTQAITKLLPSYASKDLANQYVAILDFMANLRRPVLAIFGGAKISDKVGFIKQISGPADQMFIGGALANAFWQQAGTNIGRSYVESGQEALIDDVNQLLIDQKEVYFLPSDVKVADSKDAKDSQNKLIDAIIDQDIILDLGQTSSQVLERLVYNSGSVIWNGNLGYTENPIFQTGTLAVINALNDTKKPCLIGGGDTVGFLNQVMPGLDYSGLVISTGGGAMLDLISQEKLVGVDSLLDA